MIFLIHEEKRTPHPNDEKGQRRLDFEGPRPYPVNAPSFVSAALVTVWPYRDGQHYPFGVERERTREVREYRARNLTLEEWVGGEWKTLGSLHWIEEDGKKAILHLVRKRGRPVKVCPWFGSYKEAA